MTSLKSGPLQTERMPNGKRRLLRDLVIESDRTDWTIVEGYETDYSSIPAVGRALVRWSRVDIAGVVHDHLYSDAPGNISRGRADRIWRLVAQAGDHGANAFQGWICWLALRGYGGIVWWGYRKNGFRKALAYAQAAIISVLLFAASWWLAKATLDLVLRTCEL